MQAQRKLDLGIVKTAILEGANGGRIFYFYTLLGFQSKKLKWLKTLYF